MIICNQNKDGFVVTGAGSKICIQANTNRIIFDKDFVLGEYEKRVDAEFVLECLMDAILCGASEFYMASAKDFDHDEA